MDEKEKKPKKPRSLSVNIVIVFSSLLAIVLFINNGLSIYFNFQKEQDIIFSNQNRIALDASNTVKAFIQDKLTLLHTVSRFDNPLNLDQSKQKLIPDRLLSEEPSFRQISLINAQKEELAKTSRFSNSMPMHLTAIDMDIIISTVRKNKNYISSVYFDQSTQEPIIVIAIPIKDVFGDLKGAVLAEVNLKFMWDLVGNIKVGNKGVAYVVDKQGNLLAFEDKRRVLKKENLSKLKEVNEFISGEKESVTNATALAPGIDGTQVLSSYASLESPNWAVIVELPVSEAYQPLIKEIGISVLIMLLSIALGTVAILYFSKRITRPIIKLTDFVRKIGQGNLGAQIDINTNDEIGILASSFNQMTGELKEYQQGLEEKVSQRTKELNQKVSELENFKELTIGRELEMIKLKQKIAELEAKK